MISPSTPEPLCDVLAQLRALHDPLHPKDAVWLALGTPLPQGLKGAIVVDHPSGVLVTTNPAKASRFSANPSDEALADILGYVEPKWHVTLPAVVVQARSRGLVVTEMLSSAGRADEAIEVARSHGNVRVISLVEALLRRSDIRRAEGAY